jgi:hypothetical protein
MTSYLYAKQVRIFDYPKFAEPFRDRLRENTERLAADADPHGDPYGEAGQHRHVPGQKAQPAI